MSDGTAATGAGAGCEKFGIAGGAGATLMSRESRSPSEAATGAAAAAEEGAGAVVVSGTVTGRTAGEERGQGNNEHLSVCLTLSSASLSSFVSPSFC